MNAPALATVSGRSGGAGEEWRNEVYLHSAPVSKPTADTAIIVYSPAVYTCFIVNPVRTKFSVMAANTDGAPPTLLQLFLQGWEARRKTDACELASNSPEFSVDIVHLSVDVE